MSPLAQDVLIIIQQEKVRFTAQQAVQELQLQIFDQTGQLIYDSGAVAGPELTWNLQQGNGEVVKSGLYAYRLSLKENGPESVRVRQGHLIVDRAQERDGRTDRLWITSQHDGGVGTELTVVHSGAETIAGTSAPSGPSGDATARHAEAEAKNGNHAALSAVISGTAGTIAKFTSATDLGDSVITEVSGRIGIGLVNPSTKLAVATPTNSYGITHTDGVATLSTFVGAGSTGVTNGGWIGTVSNHDLRFFTANGPSRMAISTSGNVGIGTPSPTAAKLEVRENAGLHGILGFTTEHNHAGVRGENGGGGHGLEGVSNGTLTGIYGSNTGSGHGIIGESASSSGVWALGAFGVTGITNSSSGAAIYGTSQVFGVGLAGRFDGNVQVNGTLSKASGSFKIDHPLDPENKYLYHSFVESPDMMNVYNGNVTTDANGVATVTLPDYFEALNRDFRYQLTPVGQFARTMVAGKIQKNRFTIRTDQPYVEVSWQVTGIRHDAYAEANRIQVEVEKPAAERGSLLHPVVFGKSPQGTENAEGSSEAQELIKKHRERLQNANR
ncbi:MAG TPA: hypothetical protein VJ302_19865 [Blastocatellia bacterium]|nr:hypothetical protein [Blastocatellia bacterium]